MLSEFEQTLLVQNELGHAHGFQVKIEDKNFYGEGSSMKIAKGLAALDALTYIKVGIYLFAGYFRLATL